MDHLGGDGDGDLLGAERLDVRRGNLGGRVGVGDLTPLLHQRKPGAAHNGVARFLAMVLGNVTLEGLDDRRFKVDDEVADTSIRQDVGNRLEQRRLGRVQVQLAQADGSAADHAGIGVLAAHGVADQTRFTPGQQLASLVQRKELDFAAADRRRLVRNIVDIAGIAARVDVGAFKALSHLHAVGQKAAQAAVNLRDHVRFEQSKSGSTAKQRRSAILALKPHKVGKETRREQHRRGGFTV